MNITSSAISENLTQKQPSPLYFLLDLTIYIALMFLIREIYFSEFHFIANGLFWSSTTLIAAMLFMRIRNVSWKEIGLRNPDNYKQAITATIFILIFTIVSMVILNILKDNFGLQLAADESDQQAASKFGELAGNWLLFLSIIPFVWVQSAFEELLDRGFLINWVERVFSSTWFATIIAVLFQAMLFGFRHSYDLSERSVTVGLIGLAMGVGYVAFGRNLWPLIIAHCVLNTMSLLGRV
ncbi:CPBP family intramembrane glutamic endopeptidase [Aliikangiella sp. G2MR2-5]|uniref:CPBP family intramembrane glutamic endopeptidase n=1 Tax=Aliikangiella sp. G2MR2-5 TaxID=2788943 RepID=UPI0018AA7E80|nr:CPBP family intramembrane glutamic endopeptidase [Aliikangiella sp. G2MR2-5]